jgi:hypothetical protein
MAGNSKESLLSWLALQSRTQEWDSVVVIDRSKLNLVLIQGYIDRFNSESYFPPITDSTPTVHRRYPLKRNTSMTLLWIIRDCLLKRPTFQTQRLRCLCGWSVAHR